MPTQITLTANLQTISGAETGGSLRITLCGFGPVIPTIPGTAVIADAGIPQFYGPQQGSTPISVQLWGNDVIQPATTFYEVAVLDANENVIQTGMYSFTGAGPFDLSSAAQIIAPYGFSLGNLRYMPCTGSGRNFVAPGPVIAVAYNGIFMRANQPAPAYSYTVTGEAITLTFTASAGDKIDALCIV